MKGLWIEAWTAANFCKVFTFLNFAIAPSRRRTGGWEFSARLLSHRTPEIMRLSIDPDEHLVQVPMSLRKRPMMNAPFPDLRGEHRTEPVPPETHRFVADIDATFEQQIFNLPQ